MSIIRTVATAAFAAIALCTVPSLADTGGEPSCDSPAQPEQCADESTASDAQAEAVGAESSGAESVKKPRARRKGESKDKPIEYRPGSGPIKEREAAPVNEDWPDTGFWFSTTSGARHNSKCDNYRKTKGYPCSETDGRPCGKCGG